MFKSPYSTTPCKNHRVDDIAKALGELAMHGELRWVSRNPLSDKNTQDFNSLIYVVDSKVKTVKQFAHPMVIQFPNQRNDSPDFIIFDARSITKLDVVNDRLVPTSHYHFALLRAQIMDSMWLRGNPEDLFNCGVLQLEVFVSLLSENLARRMNLDKAVADRVSCLAGYYYLCLFKDTVETDEETFTKNMSRVARAVRLPLPDVLAIMEGVQPMMDIGQFVEALKQHGNSVRLEKMNVGLLYTMLGGVWFGPNATETVAVALEHPPTWVAMMTTAINDRSFNKTILTDLIKRKDRLTKSADDFTLNVLRAVKN